MSPCRSDLNWLCLILEHMTIRLLVSWMLERRELSAGLLVVPVVCGVAACDRKATCQLDVGSPGPMRMRSVQSRLSLKRERWLRHCISPCSVQGTQPAESWCSPCLTKPISRLHVAPVPRTSLEC